MASEPFEQNSIGWQLQLLRQNISEWWELQTSNIGLPALPQLEIPGLDQLAEAIGWTIALLLAVWFLWRLTDVLLPYIYWVFSPTPTRRKEAPVPKRLSVEGWLKRSRELQSRGNYGEACRCLYLAMLQGLNDQGIIPHQSSLTDGEYQGLLPQNQRRSAYQTLFQTHEEFWFGEEEITPDRFGECQDAYREIERKL